MQEENQNKGTWGGKNVKCGRKNRLPQQAVPVHRTKQKLSGKHRITDSLEEVKHCTQKKRVKNTHSAKGLDDASQGSKTEKKNSVSSRERRGWGGNGGFPTVREKALHLANGENTRRATRGGKEIESGF